MTVLYARSKVDDYNMKCLFRDCQYNTDEGINAKFAVDTKLQLLTIQVQAEHALHQ